MELKRGKTFIKSSLQISHEKPSDSAAAAPVREDAGPWSVSLGGQQRLHGEKGSQVSPSDQGHGRYPNKGAQPHPDGGPAALCGATFKLVRKSKTHDSVPEASRAATTTGQLVGSTSFPGPPSGPHIIDYRHFVPQMPFVPAVAKSIPRKRISLKKPKKCFRNLFHIRRNKTENLAALEGKGKSLSSPGDPSVVAGRQGQAFFSLEEGLGLDILGQDVSDSELLPDSLDLCRVLCEDVASLKSFDSLTGCGEIFADESSVPTLELNDSPVSPSQVSQALESKASRGPSQGSIEQLALPTQNEVSDFTKFWDSVNCSFRQQQCTLLGPWLEGPQGTDTAKLRPDVAGLAELPLFPCRGPPSGSKASSTDTGTPKSEQPESVSTSDEGYYDSFSPGLEEDKKEAPSPSTPAAAFPRDSYSGDALYELFYDPSEGPVGPSLDDDLCVSESLSGPALGTPLSMCSFHVGAEENLAPAPSPDLLGQGFLQSSWKGKECLLKLCDTELAITMGIVNWLRRTPPVASPVPMEPKDPEKKLEGKRDQAPDVGSATVCLAPGKKTHLNTQSLLAGESMFPGGKAKGTTSPSQDHPLEERPRGHPEGSLSSVESAARAATDTSRKSKTVSLPAWPTSQKGAGPAGNPRQCQGPWRPGYGGKTLEAGPALAGGCLAHVAALQMHLDGQPLTQDIGSGFFRQPQAWDPNFLQQKQTSSSPSGVTICCLPSLASSQDQKHPNFILNLSQLRLELPRLGAQACTSVEDLNLQRSPKAVGQTAHRGYLDCGSPSAPAAQGKPQGQSTEILSLTLDSLR
ncbi:PREDICTED: APC membrane recruitment protein 3 [Chinchilla lanigera]|uniref:APC membrane recruitment protein 3 n=1 Tax=Chinchilla lanigera TaxID=34839 RepID=UPI00038ECDCD|nr:PREDICTED: APC membrane recruitment protein 3 [Chinchilla lanigera]XP_013376505.1 PREDICTED: APC membrane recruitment protein 3 [Chinchilla lanigera]